jgi:rRNA-processing protein FCF1
MYIDPLPFVEVGHLRAVLADQQSGIRDAGNVRVQHGDDGQPADQGQRLFAYLEWANEAASQLASVLRAETVRQLVLTERYRMLSTVGPTLIGGITEQRRVLNGLINAEVEERVRLLGEAISGLEARALRWADPEMFVVADTNFFMQHQMLFDEIDFHGLLSDSPEYADGKNSIRLLVPLAVIDELDSQKRRNEPDKRKRARQVLAVLDGLFTDPESPTVLTPHDAAEGASPVTIEVLFDPPNHVRLARTDDEIIERMVAEQPIAGRPFTLITYDTGLSMRARKAGLKVIKLVEPELPAKPRKSKGTRYPGNRDAEPEQPSDGSPAGGTGSDTG